MKIALITIGNELLTGFTVNTNAAWIGQKLIEMGAEVHAQITISDNVDEIKSNLKQLTDENYTHIIVTGGLGPTHDDVTPTAFYQYFGAKPTFDEEYWQELTKRFAKRNNKISEKNRNQAMKPDNGKLIPNPVGSARGLHFKQEGVQYFAMPGVPSEMKAMMETYVLPLIDAENDKTIIVKTIKTTGIPESSLMEKIGDIVHKFNPEVKTAFLPQFIGVDIRLFSENNDSIRRYINEVKTIVSKNIFGYDDDTLESAVAQLLIKNKMTIATAESCTGGLLAHRLTNVSGSSQYLLGGIVTYSNEAKMKFVSVKEETLNAHGAVSEETAKEMAAGVKQAFQSDIGIGITGIAGPTGGTEEKPVGTVCIGLALKEKLIVKKFNFVHNRKANKLLSSQAALNLCRLELLK